MNEPRRVSIAAVILAAGIAILAGPAYAQSLPGRLPGTLPGQQPPATPQPAAAPTPAPGPGVPPACCQITSIDKGGVVSAREGASGRIVQFKVGNAVQLQKLQVGQAVHANFDAKQVSVDGKTMCCTITSVTAAPATASKTPAQSVAVQKTPQSIGAPQGLPGQKLPGQGPMGKQPPDKTPGATSSQPIGMGPGRTPGSPGSPPSGPGGLAAGAAGGAAAAKVNIDRHSEPLPQVTAGTPRKVQKDNKGGGNSAFTQRVRNPNVLQLKGIDEIRAATGLRQEARDMLVIHARTLEAQDHDGYIVNSQLAEEWFRKNPDVKAILHEAAKDKGKKKKKGCSTHHISTGCLKNEVSQAVDDLTQVWRKAYHDTTDEVGRAWNKVQDCFADKQLNPLKIPVKFSETPEFSVPVKKGPLSGNVVVGVPVDADFVSELRLFYIPCMPFAVRPRSLGADGTMEAGGALRANLTVTGEFDHTFTIPPNGVKIPIQIIPIIVGGVPIAEMDVSLYVEGNVQLHGKGTLNGDVKLQSTQKTAFEFECSGHACKVSSKGVPPKPATAMESIKLDGRLHVKPAIYTALQLSFDWELLEARAGPQPFLMGELYGCGAAAATQTSGAPSTSTSSYSVVADLDWGLDIRAEAFAANKKVAGKKWKMDVSHGTAGKNQHLYFKDLAQSTGLVPTVTGATQVAAGQLTAFMITMPECYPYRDAQDNVLQYKVTWTGGASGSAAAPPAVAGKQDGKVLGGGSLTRTSGGSPSSTCTFLTGQANCSGGPRANTAINLTWPAGGDYVLTVAPVSDKHGHTFDASRAKQINVKVQ